ncbi:MAG TPA: preprotein translocase subunit SecY [Candidatus Nitrosotenuis sp.]|nr:preprotein translocase subunit SecY [Candidatus Nitrosotenuis sp.]
MVGSLFHAFQVPDVRQRLGWVAFGFALFTLSVHVGMPGVNTEVWGRLVASGDVFRFLGMMTGGALNHFAVTALGITPYINASIIMQLLTVVIPQLHEMQKEGGEMGRRKLAQYTRWLTLALCLLTGTALTVTLVRHGQASGQPVFTMHGFGFYVMVVLALTAGTCFMMWLGELMSEKGVGNGVSLLIFAGIVLSFPNYLNESLKLAGVAGAGYVISLLIFFALMVGLIAAIVLIHLGQRKIPVQYPRKVVGRRVYGGQSTYIPMRVNNAGVISIIFAISILYLPYTLLQFGSQSAPWVQTLATFINTYFAPHSLVYNLVYAGLVVFFTFFYSAITFKVDDVADNMRKYGGFIPGIRPGRPTAEYLEKVLTRITLIAGLFLAFVAIAPDYFMRLTGVTTFGGLGATSMLIIVGVALDTMQQIEARLVMRHYQGFMK